MRWLRIRKGCTGVTLRSAKILQIKQITSLLNKKYSKISSKTTAIADNISSLVLSTEKYTSNASLRRRWMRENRLSSGKRGSELATVLAYRMAHRRRPGMGPRQCGWDCFYRDSPASAGAIPFSLFVAGQSSETVTNPAKPGYSPRIYPLNTGGCQHG